MNVWVVVSYRETLDNEKNRVEGVYATKELANKARDEVMRMDDIRSAWAEEWEVVE